MAKYISYPVTQDGVYIDTAGISAANVLVVDRNGIGVKHSTQFVTNTVNFGTLQWDWYGIRAGGQTASNWLIEASMSIGASSRTYVYWIGPIPIAGTVYSVYTDGNIAHYKVQSGDTTEDVKDGLKAAIDSVSWGVTVTTTTLASYLLQVEIGDTTTEFTKLVGYEKYKAGRYLIYNAITYIVQEQESLTGPITLPALAASYNFTALKSIPSDIQTYLQEPIYEIFYSETSGGSTDVAGIPDMGNVPFNECVVYQPEQRIYFNQSLISGEIIKVISK